MTICQIGVVLRKKMTEDATKETTIIEAVTVIITLAKVEAIHEEDKVRAIRILMAIMVTIKMVVAKATKTQHLHTATQAMAGVVARVWTVVGKEETKPEVVKVTLTQLLMVAMGKHEEDKLSNNNSLKEEEDQDQVTAILVNQTQDQIQQDMAMSNIKINIIIIPLKDKDLVSER